MKQPTVSKIERREDVNLSTLRRFIEALGGKLHVTAEFNDGSVEIGRADLGDGAIHGGHSKRCSSAVVCARRSRRTTQW